MTKMGLRIGYAGLLLATMTTAAACSVPANEPNEPALETSNDPSANPPGSPKPTAAESTPEKAAAVTPPPVVGDDRGDDGNAAAPGNAATIAELTIGDDHMVTFIDIEPGSDAPADVLVSETHGKTSASALTSLADLRGATVTAHDVFFALSEPGTVVPVRIAKIDRVLIKKQGWGLSEIKKLTTLQPMAAGSNACANASFTAATYGGILPNNSSWLDQHPGDEYSHFLYQYYGPNGLTNVSTDRFAFTLARYDISQYRGKACVESIEGAGLATHRYYHQGENQWMNLDPIASFQYRRPGDTNWSVAKSITVPANTVRSMEWAWYGHNNEKWDWRMTVSRALPQDYIDYMRSYLP